MIYGKITDGLLTKYSGGHIHQDDKIYVNVSESTLSELGYKPLRIEDAPTEEREGYYPACVYTETDTEIVGTWEWYEEPEEEV